MHFQHKHALIVLIGLMLAIGFYSVHLNHQFYSRHAPFFDSCSYLNQMAQVHDVTTTVSVVEGVKLALAGNVALPFLETVAAAPLGRPTRAFGTWIQCIWLAAMAVSVYWYLARYRGLHPAIALCLVLPLVSFPRIYDWNGGLQDLRMDLSLYIFTTLTVTWYLVTYETEESWPWLVSGVFAGLACMGRATAPVYLAMMIGPLLALRFVFGPNRLKLAKNVGLMTIPVVVGASAFLIYNFRYLYYYYVEWSPDANRHLPFSEASTHFITAGLNLGRTGAKLGVIALMIQLASRWRGKMSEIDWRLFWVALAPPLFLAVRGAGLNGFVSMPAVFGLALFPFLPYRTGVAVPKRMALRVVLCVLACGIALSGAVDALRGQFLSGKNPTNIVAIKELLDHMSADAMTRPSRTAHYVMPLLGEMHACSIQNVLRFEYGAQGVPDGLRTSAGVTFNHPRELAFSASDPFLWEHELPGMDEEHRLEALKAIAMKDADFVILPTAPALAFLENERGDNLINVKTREIGRRILETGAWEMVGFPVRFTENEEYQLYRRVR